MLISCLAHSSTPKVEATQQWTSAEVDAVAIQKKVHFIVTAVETEIRQIKWRFLKKQNW
jgi:hypothetical protein